MIRPILCIVPGWGGTKETWKEFTTQAEGYFDVHCIELPCFGGVACPNTAWGVEEYGEYVYEQLEKIRKQSGNKKVILLGHSFGGQVATYVADKYPDSFDELVLVAAAVVRPKRIMKRVIMRTCARIVKTILGLNQENLKLGGIRKKIYHVLSSPDYAETSGIMREIFKKVIREDMQHALLHITKKTLVFWGKCDTYTPLRHGKLIAKKLPNSELIVFKNGRHGLHHTHATDILNTLKARYTTG
ncbi:MAG TPA: alpha/beta hydrolase [Candidatus Magasanikbacteria bacterium]|nr:alpha/beta hydrolase [Candidatus Magasanikbacteria bacterium]